MSSPSTRCAYTFSGMRNRIVDEEDNRDLETRRETKSLMSHLMSLDVSQLTTLIRNLSIDIPPDEIELVSDLIPILKGRIAFLKKQNDPLRQD